MIVQLGDFMETMSRTDTNALLEASLCLLWNDTFISSLL